MTSNDTTYTAALARFQRGYSAMFALIEDYPVELYEKPGVFENWSPRQLIAHMIGLLVEANARFDEITAQSNINGHFTTPSHDAQTGSLAVQEREGRTWLDLVAEMHDTYSRFELKAADIPPHRTAADARYQEWLTGLWKDCIEHIGHLINFTENA